MDFLYAVWDWVVFSSLVASLMVPILLLVKFAFKDKLAPSWHYVIWFLLLIRLVFPFAPASSLSLFNVVPSLKHIIQNIHTGPSSAQRDYFNVVSPIAEAVVTQNHEQSGTFKISSANPAEAIKTSENDHRDRTYPSLIALIIWLSGAVVFSIHVALINGRLLLRIRANAQDVPEAIQSVLEQCKTTLNIRSKIPLITTPIVQTPALFGFFRPVLLIPSEPTNQLNTNQLKHVFLHELTHYKRKDFMVNGLVVLLKVLHWFNPLVWYGFYRMRQDSEIACDALALSRMEPEERIGYGYTMIHLLSFARPQRVPGLIGIMTSQSTMKRRILMISSFRKRHVGWMALGTALIIVLGGIMLTGAKSTSAVQTAPSRVYVADIQGKNFMGSFTGKMMVVPDPAKVVVGFSLKDSKPDKTTSAMAQESKALGAINAGASDSESVFGPAVSAAGFIIKDGKAVFDGIQDDAAAQDAAALTDKGLLIVGKHTLPELKELGAREAVSAGPPLISKGTALALPDSWGIASRTAIGQKADGTLLLLVTDGRTKESMGATVKDVQNLLLEQGAVNAALLDGGSLSTMYFDGNVVNNPSAGEQIVSSTFLVMP